MPHTPRAGPPPEYDFGAPGLPTRDGEIEGLGLVLGTRQHLRQQKLEGKPDALRPGASSHASKQPTQSFRASRAAEHARGRAHALRLIPSRPFNLGLVK